jgi:SNF2 family DNA or RNA helicase
VRRTEAELASQCRTLLASGIELKALGASTLAGKVRQLASGAIYTGPETEDGQPWEEVHTVKLDALREILEEAQGEPVLCFYWFKHEMERIRAAFPYAREATDQAALDAWDRREVPLLLAHPQSAGHGLNLQAGHVIVFMSLPYSHELFEQACGRELRIGQASPWVVAHVLLAGDADWAVLSLLQKKGETQGALMKHVEMLDEVFT